MVNNPKRKKVIGSVTIDSSKKYQAEALVSLSETKSTKNYKSKLEILQPNADPITLEADIVYKPGKVMTSKVALIGALEKPASLDCKYIENQHVFLRYRFSLRVRVRGSVQKGINFILY